MLWQGTEYVLYVTRWLKSIQFKMFIDSLENGSEMLSTSRLKSPVIKILSLVLCLIDKSSENSLIKDVECWGGLEIVMQRIGGLLKTKA